jgi:glycosyltransferase involved in cell wall biosynthesis
VANPSRDEETLSNLTAFLILRNEEHLLPACLASLAGVADFIVAVDTGSDDRTPDILSQAAIDASQPPLRWQKVAFVNFGQARQAALDLVRTEWALWIDGDEVVSPALGERIRSLRASSAWEAFDAYLIPLENRVYGRTMRGRNLAGQYRPRLFRTRLGRVSCSVVHESIQLPPDCRWGHLAEPIRHHTFTSWQRYLAKVDLYTGLEASTAPPRSTLYLLGHLLVTGPATFWREYVWRTGFRDGWPGLVWAVTTAWSSLLRDLKQLGWYRLGVPHQ